jgi:class 3 adenylate cyclase
VKSVPALVLIYDIRGFTSATKRMHVADIGAFATAAHRAILDAFASRPPTFVKNLGDGHLLLWETDLDPDRALLADVVAAADRGRDAFSRFVAERGGEAAGLPRHVGVGIAHGVVSRSDDYYGVALNLAARLQNLSRPEGLSLDETVHGAVVASDPRRRDEFRSMRVALKGLGKTRVHVRRPFSWGRFLANAGSVAAAVALPVGYLALCDAGLGLPGGGAVRDAIDARASTVFRRPQPASEVAAAAARMRRRLREALLSARVPNGMLFQRLLRSGEAWKAVLVEEEPDVWASSQEIAGCLKDPDADIDSLRSVLPGLVAIFEEGRFHRKGGRPYGWLSHPGKSYTQAEPTLWSALALALALGRPGLVSDAERPAWLERLALAQAACMAYRPDDTGGWNVFPDQARPEVHSPYSATLALLVLLDTRAAGLPFDGSEARRDELLAKTARWLAADFVADPASPGWRRTSNPNEVVSAGLTVQALAELLRAESEAGIEVPPAILAAVPGRLAALLGTPLAQAADAGEYELPFANLEGTIEPRGEAINFLWHPWAVDLAARGLERAARRGAATLDRVRVERALGHFVVALEDDAVREATKGYLFMAAESLYGLSSIGRGLAGGRTAGG